MRNEKGQFVKGFGFWTGKKRPGLKTSTTFKKGNVAWNKGTHIQTNNALIKYQKSPNYINPNKGKHPSPETIAKIKIARAKQILPTGPAHWHWKGGTKNLRKQLQETYVYKNWRATIFKRDNYTCQNCGSTGYLQVHHIKPYSKIIEENKITTVEEAKNCFELWDLLNGKSLCVKCHLATDTFGNRVLSK
jgi:hypothetical protein